MRDIAESDLSTEQWITAWYSAESVPSTEHWSTARDSAESELFSGALSGQS